MRKSTAVVPVSLLILGITMLNSAMAEDKAVGIPGDNGKLKIFILVGQSNMEGPGAVKGNKRNDGKGSLEYLVKNPETAKQYEHVVDEDGDWRVRDDVWVTFFDRKGDHSIGYGTGKDRIGPEFQFGHVVGDAYDEQVLLIKAAWGGKSLANDFRPPSSEGETGKYYKMMMDEIKDVLKNLGEYFPDYKGQGYEIAGFGWHQGWNDGCTRNAVDQYEENMVNFIRDVRKGLGVKDLPFVIAKSGFGGWNQKVDRRLGIMKAQENAANHPDFKGNATCVETRDFWRSGDESPARHGFHWCCNAESFFLIGDSMGKAMVELVEK